MKKDVSQVRKSIAKRKREKSISSVTSFKQEAPDFKNSFPQDEEKHGYLPFSTENYTDSSDIKEKFTANLVMKSILAGILFFAIATIHRADMPWLIQPKQWTSQALTEEFPFASVNQWYQNKFGSPLAMTPDKEETEDQPAALPVNGTVSQSFQANGEGIRIAADEKSQVVAVEAGTVIFAGNDSETGKTVIVQHADKSKSIYGYLSSIDVYQYQFIDASTVLGEFDPSTGVSKDIYFGIQKNNQYLDPIQVIQVDETP
ncbi:M23 family metallopeptidase [Sediminibacillus massiliensis]|uniref:M23 family metallopeptidase n=1 Tax=Sediminibacillus massiliensis TaxID=1926277 RepID=UPI0009886A6B|nr:M23 family metallopeptidase [Sediminibacillus massiliensis]